MDAPASYANSEKRLSFDHQIVKKKAENKNRVTPDAQL